MKLMSSTMTVGFVAVPKSTYLDSILAEEVLKVLVESGKSPESLEQIKILDIGVDKASGMFSNTQNMCKYVVVNADGLRSNNQMLAAFQQTLVSRKLKLVKELDNFMIFENINYNGDDEMKNNVNEVPVADVLEKAIKTVNKMREDIQKAYAEVEQPEESTEAKLKKELEDLRKANAELKQENKKLNDAYCDAVSDVENLEGLYNGVTRDLLVKGFNPEEIFNNGKFGGFYEDELLEDDEFVGFYEEEPLNADDFEDELVEDDEFEEEDFADHIRQVFEDMYGTDVEVRILDEDEADFDDEDLVPITFADVVNHLVKNGVSLAEDLVGFPEDDEECGCVDCTGCGVNYVEEYEELLNDENFGCLEDKDEFYEYDEDEEVFDFSEEDMDELNEEMLETLHFVEELSPLEREVLKCGYVSFMENGIDADELEQLRKLVYIGVFEK